MLRTLRYYIELVAMPIFTVLALHLAGAGIETFMGEPAHAHDEHAREGIFNFTEFFSLSGLAALVLLVVFVWIWHRPLLKKWVPCSHEHCHNEQAFAHLMATVALCLHFFPEAEIRHALLENAHKHTGDFLGLLGFASHFAVDVIVAIFISSYWPKRWQFLVSLLGITIVWLAAFTLAQNSADYSSLFSHGAVLLFSSFLLAMFIHKPHKPEPQCLSCDEKS